MSAPVTDARLTEIRAAVQRAHTEVGTICAEGRFKMTIPADPARDSDLILTNALEGLDELLSEVERLKTELAQTRELGEQVIGAEARAVRELEAEVASLRAHAAERAAFHGSCTDEATSPPAAFTDALGSVHPTEEGP